MQVKKEQLELDIEQETGSKLGKEYIKVIYCHPAYLTYMQRNSCKMPGWMNHKLESRLLGEISITSDMQVTPPFCQKQGRTKEPLDESDFGIGKKQCTSPKHPVTCTGREKGGTRDQIANICWIIEKAIEFC